MKALRIHAHGGPEVLSLDDIAEPVAGPGQALVRVLAASINHLDMWTRRGMPGVTIPFPRVLGCDGTGEILALGEGVSDLIVGQKIILEPGYSDIAQGDARFALNDHFAPDYSIRGEHGDGFDQEIVALDARYCLPLPDGIDPVQAAALPLVFVTAWGALVTRAALQAGETLLMLAGSSGVGSAAIQIAKDLGARVVATAGSDAKLDLCRELGADEVIDHRDEAWGKRVKSLTDGAGADVVFEHVGPATWRNSMGALARNGRLVTCGGTTGPIVKLALPHLFIKNQSVLGSTMGPRVAFPEILSKVAAGIYRPVIDSVLPMSEARAAHQRLEDRLALGKLVLIPAE
jgi:NADPH:quinone reductase-like Zn-dependent oxidoreductase